MAGRKRNTPVRKARVSKRIKKSLTDKSGSPSRLMNDGPEASVGSLADTLNTCNPLDDRISTGSSSSSLGSIGFSTGSVNIDDPIVTEANEEDNSVNVYLSQGAMSLTEMPAFFQNNSNSKPPESPTVSVDAVSISSARSSPVEKEAPKAASIELTIFPSGQEGDENGEYVFEQYQFVVAGASGTSIGSSCEDASSSLGLPLNLENQPTIQKPKQQYKKRRKNDNPKKSVKKKQPKKEAAKAKCTVKHNIFSEEGSSSSSSSVLPLSPMPELEEVEIIDIDDLPEIPDSPIGDDVVEIPVAEYIQSSVVDLTDEADDSLIAGQGASHSRADNDGDLDDSDDDFPNVLTDFGSQSFNTSNSSSKREDIHCPVCMDERSVIRMSNRLLMSTRCGHLFCDVCIKEAIKVQQKCPACRHKLTLKQIHPLYI